jgi:hypothetical protein
LLEWKESNLLTGNPYGLFYSVRALRAPAVTLHFYFKEL